MSDFDYTIEDGCFDKLERRLRHELFLLTLQTSPVTLWAALPARYYSDNIYNLEVALDYSTDVVRQMIANELAVLQVSDVLDVVLDVAKSIALIYGASIAGGAAIGALIGSIAGGVGAVPGAAVGAKAGLWAANAVTLIMGIEFLAEQLIKFDYGQVLNNYKTGATQAWNIEDPWFGSVEEREYYSPALYLARGHIGLICLILLAVLAVFLAKGAGAFGRGTASKLARWAATNTTAKKALLNSRIFPNASMAGPGRSQPYFSVPSKAGNYGQVPSAKGSTAQMTAAGEGSVAAGKSEGALSTEATAGQVSKGSNAGSTSGSGGVAIEQNALNQAKKTTGTQIKGGTSISVTDAGSAEAAADAALASGRTKGAAAELRVGDHVFTDVSTGGNVRVVHPEVQAALSKIPLKDRTPWHGHCAEVGCLSQALSSGVDPAGGVSKAVNIGKSGRGHGTIKQACKDCQKLLDQFGVKYD